MPWLKYLLQLAIPVFLTSLKAQSQGNIVLKEKISSTIAPTCTNSLRGTVGMVSTAASSTKVSGYVVDEKGVGLPYASIQIKGSNNGTSCDSTGFFELETKGQAKKLVIVASCVGYTESQKEINTKKESFVEIRLTTNSTLSGEVVVTAMGYTRVGRITGSYTVIKKKTYLQKIKSFFAGDSISVYPNPARGGGEIKIELKKQEAGEYAIDLYDMQGQLVKSSAIKLNEHTNTFAFQIPSVAPGSYLLNITNKRLGKKLSEKIIIR